MTRIMIMSRWRWTSHVLAMLGLSALLCGCGGKKDARDATDVSTAEQVDPSVVAFRALRDELMSFQGEQQREAVIVRLRKALDEDILSPYDGTIFSWLLGELVTTDEGLLEARDLYLSAAVGNEERANSAYGILADAYLRNGNKEGALAWCADLLAQPLSQDLCARVWLRVFLINLEDENYQACLDGIPAILKSLSPANAERILGQVVNGALQKGEFDWVRKMMTAVHAQNVTDESLLRFLTLAKVDLLLTEGNTATARDLLMSVWREVPDKALALRMARLVNALHMAKDEASMEALASAAIGEFTDKPMSRTGTLKAWVEAAASNAAHDAFVERFTRSLDAGIPIATLMAVFEKGFYGIMASGTAPQKEACVALAKRISGALEEKDSSVATRMAMLQLDGAFYSQDFREALRVIEEGIPGQDEAWHQVLINKVHAHLALAEGRTDDAIAGFRAHMKTVEQWEQPQVNPETGVMMHREAVLGFNEKRIGDIYAGAGKPDEAAAAYQRARGYYRKALETVEADSREHAVYEDELAKVPSGE